MGEFEGGELLSSSRSRGLSAAAWASIIIIIIIVVGVAAWAATRHHAARTTTSPTTTTSSSTTTSSTSSATSTTTSTSTSTTTTSSTSTTTSTTTTKTSTTTSTWFAHYVYSPPLFIPPKNGYAAVIETSKAFVVVGPVGSKIPNFDNKGKPIIVVKFKVNKTATEPPENLSPYNTINPSYFRSYYADALILSGRKETNPLIRSQIYEAVNALSNYYLPIIWVGQGMRVFVYWSWLHGRYYHPILSERFDLLTEDTNAPKIPLGIGSYENNASTLVEIQNGWPQWDPAKSYEGFGWALFHNIGDTLVTYWMNETRSLAPDLAVAWAHNKNGTIWYFVIRGNVKAYDPWHNKVYTINATDVLFTLWRIARLNLDPSWLISTFINVNASTVMTESEFNKILSSGSIYTDYGNYHGKVTSLSQLLKIFNYSGPTAGVVELKLYKPYGAILDILADPFTMVIPMKYLFDNVPQLQGKYIQAMIDSKAGRNPAAWAKYIRVGEQEPTHLYLHKYPIGTGPYYVKEYKENSYIVLHYNPYYWNSTLWVKMFGKPEPQHKLVIILINNDPVTRIEILKRGQADGADRPWESIPLGRLKDVKGYQYPGTNFKIIVKTLGLTPDITYLVFNVLKPPFNNKYVRLALAYAVPYKQIYSIIYANYMTYLHGVLPAGFVGYNNNILPYKYDFNMTKALEYIKKSGIDPSKYSFEVWYLTGDLEWEKLVTFLQSTWSRLGFKITVKSFTWTTLLEKIMHPGFDVYVMGWGPDYLDPDDYAGPLFYGGTKFSVLQWNVFTSLSAAQQFLSS